MKTYIKRNEQNRKLVVVFGGWGTDQNAFVPLCTDDHDFMLYYNYSADEPLVLPDSKTYDMVVLIGWSLGVWATEYYAESMKINADLNIAVNGTPEPADDKYGIPQDIYTQTLDNINDKEMDEFHFQFFGSSNKHQRNTDMIPKRKTESYGAELRWLYNRMMENPDKRYRWDIAVSGMKDEIFPHENQVRYWQKREDTKLLVKDLPHYPFNSWGNFNNMIESLLEESGLDIANKNI